MATDVVGYSRQMEADEAGTIARVTTARAEVIEPLLARHRGRLVKLIGDGTLSVFDSVVDAVACAAAIQRAMRERNRRAPEAEQMVLRIGVNLGDVALLENDVYGDGVNVAARIEALCDPGGIMVSGTAYDHLQGKVDFPLEFAGEQRVKNINRPVRTYRARLEGVAVPTRRRPMPLRSLAARCHRVGARGRRLVGVVDLVRTARQRLDRGAAVRQSGRRRGHRPPRRRHHRGPDHRAHPVSGPGRDRPRGHPPLQGPDGRHPSGRAASCTSSTSSTGPSSGRTGESA